MYTGMSRRQFLATGGKAALGAGLAGPLLAGCGGGGQDGGPVTYWSNLDVGQDYFKQNIEKPFEKSNQGAELKVTFQPPEEMDRIVRTALQGGEGPDIVMTPGPAYAKEYIDANLFAELDEYSEQYKWDDKLLSWALELGRYEDSLYAIPYQLQTMLLYYNATLFEEKGMEPPTDRDELESMAQELMGQGIVPFAAGIGEDPAAIEWFPTVFWNHYSGPDALYQALTGEIPFSAPVFVEAIELFNTYVQNGWFGGSRQKFIDYLVADKKRAAEWMAAVPAAFNAPLPFEQGDFPSSMDDRVERQLVRLSQATDKGNFGYTAWTFWPPKSDVYIQEDSQKVLTEDITAAEFCEGLDEVFTEERKEGAVPKIIKPGSA